MHLTKVASNRIFVPIVVTILVDNDLHRGFATVGSDLPSLRHKKAAPIGCKPAQAKEIRVYECVYEYGKKSTQNTLPVLLHVLVHSDLPAVGNPTDLC